MNKGRVLILAMGLAVMTASAPAVADGDAAAGEKYFKKKCRMCHSVEADKHKGGPSLAGIYGRKAGTTSFKRYKGLKDSDIVWDEDNLDQFLENPAKFLGKKSSMNVKTKKAGNRADVVEYLETLK